MSAGTEQLLEEAKSIANHLGYRVFSDWFDGVGGGRSQTAGNTWIALDRGHSETEQLATILRTIGDDARIRSLTITSKLAEQLWGTVQQRAA